MFQCIYFLQCFQTTVVTYDTKPVSLWRSIFLTKKIEVINCKIRCANKGVSTLYNSFAIYLLIQTIVVRFSAEIYLLLFCCFVDHYMSVISIIIIYNLFAVCAILLFAASESEFSYFPSFRWF